MEFYENKEFLKSNPLQAMGDVLLLAGDIVPLIFKARIGFPGTMSIIILILQKNMEY